MYMRAHIICDYIMHIFMSTHPPLPQGIYLSTAELLDLESDTERVHLRLLDNELEELRSQLQRNKQDMIKMKETTGGDMGVESLRPAEVSKKILVAMYFL